MAAHPPLSVSCPLGSEAVGRIMISKEFESCGKMVPFKGTIVKHCKKEAYYLVVYEDSDREEMDWQDVMSHNPQWVQDEAAATPPPAKRRKQPKTADISTAAAAAAEAAAAKPEKRKPESLHPQQQQQQQSKVAKAQDSTAASPGPKAAAAAAASTPSSTKKKQQPGDTAAAAAAAIAKPADKASKQQTTKALRRQEAAAAAQASAAAAAAKPGKAAPAAAAAAAAGSNGASGVPAAKAAAAATKASKASSAAAARGAAAAAAVKPRSSKAAAARSKPDQTAAAAAGSKAPKQPKPSQKQQQQQQQQSGVDVAAAAGDQQSKVRAPRVPQPPKVAPLPEYGAARVCEQAWREGVGGFLSDVPDIRRAAQQAAEVVRLADGRPVFEAQPADLPAAYNAAEALKQLTDTAVKWEVGLEPYHRFALPPHVMDLLKLQQQQGEEGDGEGGEEEEEEEEEGAGAAAVAAVAAAMAVKVTYVKAKQPAAAAAAAGGGGDGGGEGQQELEDGKKKGGKKSAAGKKRPAAADAVAMADQQQGGVARSSSAASSSKKQKTGAASAAAAAAGGAAAAQGGAEGQQGVQQELVAVERQFRPLWVPVGEFADPRGELAQAMKAVKSDYDTAYRTAQASEEQRARRLIEENEAARAAGKPAPHKPSKRPDRVAESVMMKSGRQVNDRGAWGYVPGCKCNQKYELRAPCSLAGMHKSPISGMVHAALPYEPVIDSKPHRLQAITSVVASGTYMADADGHTHDKEVLVSTVYTGQGGCDLLGGKAQMFDQKLEDANRHMLVNWALGLPVRYLRRNDDRESSTGTSIIFDGLYWVISHWKSIGTAKVQPSIERRAHAMCRDISRGVEAGTAAAAAAEGSAPAGAAGAAAAAAGGGGGHHGKGGGGSSKGGHAAKPKASTLVVATNEVDDVLPPGLDPVRDKALLLPPPKDRSWRADPAPFKYIHLPTYDPNVPPPQPPKLLVAGSPAAKAFEGEILAAAAAGSSSGCGQFVPPKWRDAPLWNAAYVIQTRGEADDPDHGPHKLLERLNGGKLPYALLSKKAGSSTKQVAVAEPTMLPRVLVECGDWTGCTDKDCPQRQALRPLQYRLEVYKTRDCGWGVQSWDTVVAGSLVCVMIGHIMRREEVGIGTAYGDSAYIFDMAPRPDTNHLGKPLKQQQQQQQPAGDAGGSLPQQQQQQQEGQEEAGGEEDEHQDNHGPRYVLCARDEGNVARFINHSCEPNLYVQPILAGHTDTDHVLIGLLALRDIPPFTPLSYDYGVHYLQENLDGDCRCGADSCYSKVGDAAAAGAGGGHTHTHAGTATTPSTKPSTKENPKRRCDRRRW